MAEKIKILLAEDDLNFGSVLRDYLMVNGFDVVLCEDGVMALAQFEKGGFDLCITDIMMPYKDGHTLAREIKQIDSSVPLIFLTAKTLKEDVLKAYKTGADDYITKPFDSEVLLLKIKAILRRRDIKEDKKEYFIGRYIFNIGERELKSNNSLHKLSPKESLLLELLCENSNAIVSREKALKKIWGDDNYFNGRSMDVYIAKLRKYLSSDNTVAIENLHGTGFILKHNG